MSFYTLALFAHIVGVLGLFIGIALSWITIVRLRLAQTVGQVREGVRPAGVQNRLMQVSSLLVLVAGIYMTVVAWDWGPPWILVSLAGLIVMGALGGAVMARRLSAIQRVAAAEEAAAPVPPALQRQIADPILLTAVQTSGLIGLGVVFLMTIKPDLLGSLITLAVAIVLGVVSALFWPKPREASALAREARPGLGAGSD